MKYALGRMKARISPRMNYRLRRYESVALPRMNVEGCASPQHYRKSLGAAAGKAYMKREP